MNTIDFTAGVNPLGPSHKAKHEIRKLVRGIHILPSDPVRSLRRYLCLREGIGEDNIIFGNGSTHILDVLFQSLKPRTVLIPAPVSPRHNRVLREHGIEERRVGLDPGDDYSLDVTGLLGAAQDCDAVVLANPHDVTGSVIPPDDLAVIMEETERRGTTLIIDEAYIEFTGAFSPVKQAIGSSRVLIVRTFSTFHGLGGLRMGYAIGPAGLLATLSAHSKPYYSNALGPRAAVASLKDKGFRKRTLLYIEGEKAYVRDKLAGIGGVKCYVSPGNVLVVKVRGQHRALRDSFLRHHILIDEFVDEEGSPCIRFPVGTHKSNARFVRILKRIIE
ncbi:pyridoxal phosphate-dependent aminotransferase [Syntrophorhabdus aromaticivorans]|uniref:Histidinol-phosphate aminotransferase family protein n=1 Tax=Syntrophorhabdus aromaticivorans TaxID=328301 RepID=A0A971RZ42_9BACT|nr:histidinol-phosphate transaminase [Syntrophorhabdus aromaticivorans]NLW33890.1 histidinol-phosphate aminotransferase family protein [Syntrophorhabdus aromaticivorans]